MLSDLFLLLSRLRLHHFDCVLDVAGGSKVGKTKGQPLILKADLPTQNLSLNRSTELIDLLEACVTGNVPRLMASR